MMRSTRLLAALLVAAPVLAVPAVSSASIEQPSVVSEDPADWTPSVVRGDGDPRPRVDAVDQADGVLYAGGQFDTVQDASGVLYTRDNLVSFDADTGAMTQTFSPSVDDNVWAVEATADAVYIGGDFDAVDGVPRPALAKLDPVTGEVDPVFDAGFNGGRIDDIELVNGRLVVAGKNSRKLMALDPATGDNTRFIRLRISDKVVGSRGGVTVFDFAVSPDGSQLVATGNFQTVDGQDRARLFVADLTGRRAALDPWYYQPFAEDCATTAPRRVAYLQGVDYSPDGSYFVVTATGQIVDEPEDKGKTVCDAAGRFNLDDDTRPVWINYAGGDSVWSTAATGAAVYVQGHFSWLNNTNGFASQCPEEDLDVCARRKGVGAIDPQTGMALPWNPRKPAAIGGKQFLATEAGLWIASDSRKISGEEHRGLGFMPLP